MIFALLLSLTTAWAGGWKAEHETLWDTRAGKFISLQEFTAAPGEIVVLGEDHATKNGAGEPEQYIHHDNQLRLIEQLGASVGMEFLTYTFQNSVDQFLAGSLPEADFLREVHWSSGNPFEFYRPQIVAPRGFTGATTVALNIPSEIAGKVAANGKDSLDSGERALLPPVWRRGNDAYFERFKEVMKEHPLPPAELENYFWAQSLWDDTMAWRALQARASRPLVIIVGAFHVEFGGGLPYELRAQGASVKTVLQVAVDDWSAASLRAAIQPDPVYGARADFLWVHSGAAMGSGAR